MAHTPTSELPPPPPLMNAPMSGSVSVGDGSGRQVPGELESITPSGTTLFSELLTGASSYARVRQAGGVPAHQHAVAWRALWEDLRPLAHWIAQTWARNRLDEEDAVQVVWLAWWSALPELPTDASTQYQRRWLTCVGRNALLNAQRHREPLTLEEDSPILPLVPGRESEPVQELLTRESHERTQRAWERIERRFTEEEGQWLRWWILEELKPQEIARRTGKTPRQVSFRLARLRARVRGVLAEFASAVVRGASIGASRRSSP